MPRPTTTRARMRKLAALSPFELKGEFIAKAEQGARKNDFSMLNAGRGNPNWTATGPREAFFALGHFAMTESRRVWTGDDLGGMPQAHGAAVRFAAWARKNAMIPGVDLLERCVYFGVTKLGFEADAWVHELVDGIVGDNYPVPDRMLTHCEKVVEAYLDREMFDNRPPAGTFELFATEGGTAAMCVKVLCLVNPSNPPSMALADRVARQIKDIVAKKNPNLIIVTDDVYGTFVEGFRSIAADLPRNTLLVYSYSKHYGATGWRLGVIGLHENNVIDQMIAKLPAADRKVLHRRYESLSTHPEKLKFIDRLVADSRSVGLSHTAGLSLPQQIQMALFSLFDLQDEGQDYKRLVRSIVKRRLDLLLEGCGMRIAEDPRRAGYYIELDLLAEAERTHGAEFAAYLEASYEPIDPLFRLAEQTGVVLLNGGGFDGPEWSVRVSPANLDDLDYLKIGHNLRMIFQDYVAEWQAARARPSRSGKSTSSA